MSKEISIDESLLEYGKEMMDISSSLEKILDGNIANLKNCYEGKATEICEHEANYEVQVSKLVSFYNLGFAYLSEVFTSMVEKDLELAQKYKE